jgi:O-antigen/teichoic acid export membrane protein
MLNLNWTKSLTKFFHAQLNERQNLQKILINTSWLFFDRILRMFVGLIVGVWVARYLGPKQFGLLNYAAAFVGLFSAFATLGLDSIVIRDLIDKPVNKNETLGTAFVLKFVGGCFVVFSTIVFTTLIRSDSLTIMLVGIIALGTIFQAFDIIDFWFQSQVQSKYVVYAKNAAFLIITLVKIALLKIEAPLIYFAWAGLSEVFFGAISMIFVYHFNKQDIRSWTFTIEKAKYLLASSWFLILSGLAIMIYMRIDHIMLGQMQGDKAVGIYSSAVKLAEIWYFIPTAINSSVFPSIMEAKKISEVLYTQRVQKLFDTMVLLAYSVAIPLTLLSGWLVRLIFGEQFAEASLSLTLLTWAGLFVCLGVARESWMIAEGLMKISFFTTAIGALTNVILNLFLIPNYGPTGASFATLVSYFSAASLSTILFPETRKLFKMQLNSLLLHGVLKR